jgi:NADPH:quinone reductase-like Zn-dependent oxidoreductase
MAASVNPVDWKMRSGVLGRLLAGVMPEIPGLDLAGVVEAIGPSQGGGGEFTEGMPVFGMTRRGGAFAELALVSENMAARKPDGLGFAEAAALPVAGLTALQSLRDLAKLRSGQRLLVNGASGGVGSFAVQIGRVLRARVTAVTSTRNIEWVVGLGAERVIDYSKEDFTRLADEYDVIFDAVASRRFGECSARLARAGAFITTVPSPKNMAWMALARAGLAGGKRVAMVNVAPKGADLAYLAALVAEGKLKPSIERTLPLDHAPEALDESRGGHVRGKLVLSINAA